MNGATQMPTSAERQGDFGTWPTQLFDPLSGVLTPGGSLPVAKTPFPGNQIPSSRFTSRIGQLAVGNAYWNAPTAQNQAEGVNNFFTNIAAPRTLNQQTYRGDQNLGKLGSVFGRFTYSKYQNSSNYNSGSPILGIEQYFETQKDWEVSHTINLGQANVNNFRFGYLSADAPEGSAPPTPAAISALAALVLDRRRSGDPGHDARTGPRVPARRDHAAEGAKGQRPAAG